MFVKFRLALETNQFSLVLVTKNKNKSSVVRDKIAVRCDLPTRMAKMPGEWRSSRESQLSGMFASLDGDVLAALPHLEDR